MPSSTATAQRIQFAKVATADRNKIEAYYVGKLAQVAGISTLLATSNYYYTNTVSRIKNKPINYNDIREYIAASAPIHCIDGWSYLGRAIYCLGTGDVDVARHLAYYAELRSVISLLASNGVGIFDREHCIITHTNKCDKIRGDGTHQDTWNILEKWSKLQQAGDLIGSIIKHSNHSILEWLQAAGFAPQQNALAHSWLSAWGVDLRYFTQDRRRRNEVSYRPSQFRNSSFTSSIDNAKFIKELWEVFAPGSQNNRFSNLDQYLIRLALEKTRAGVLGAKFAKFEKKEAEFICAQLLNGNTNPYFDNMVDFLSRSSNGDDPLILQYAVKNTNVSFAGNHFEVISRAALMLRLATGSVKNLFKSGNLGPNELRSWWDNIGAHFSLWETSKLADPSDKWDDIEVNLEELEDWIQNNGSSTEARQFFVWLGSATSTTTHLDLTGCEAVGLWGMI